MVRDSEHQWVFHAGLPIPRQGPDLRKLIGGKAASLLDMSRAGLPVPPFFVISTECCEYFLNHDSTWPAGLEEQIRQAVAWLERQTGLAFDAGKQALLLAVRSGAAESMPGMMDTILNCGLDPKLADEPDGRRKLWDMYLQFVVDFSKAVAGLRLDEHTAAACRQFQPPSELAEQYLAFYARQTGRQFPASPWQMLVESINAVFHSWNGERAAIYRKRNSIEPLNGTAVTVQAMFQSCISGVAFTQDPTDTASKRIVVEASHGLGESVVSGKITPERFLIDRENFRAVEWVPPGGNSAQSSEKPILSPDQLVKLCEMAMQVEALAGSPVDIEWGFADGLWSLLQYRPIRGLDVARDVEAGRKEQLQRLVQLSAAGRCVWVAHNLGETLRFPTPMTWDIVRQFMSGSGGFGQMYRDFGYRLGTQHEGFLELICGRIYADPARLAKLFWGGLPLSHDLDAVRENPLEMDRPPSKFDPDRIGADFLLKLPGVVWSLIRSARLIRRCFDTAKEVFENAILPQYLQYVVQQRLRDLGRLSTDELLAELDQRCRRVLVDFAKESLKCGFLGGIAMDRLVGILVRLGGQDGGTRKAGELASTLKDDSTLKQEDLLYRVANGQASMEEFLDKFGHRAVNEMELSQPRWREDPDTVRRLMLQLQSAPRSPQEISNENLFIKYQSVEKDFPSVLAGWGGSSFREEFELYLRRARQFLPYRELGRHYLMMGYELIRLVILELARRLELGNSIFFLTRSELSQIHNNRTLLLEEAARREIRRESVQRLDVPDVIDSNELNESFGLPRKYDPTDALKGHALSAGVASGIARIVLDPTKAGNLGTEYILVCPSTDPGWTPLFPNARGLIVERGGMLSHGAIIARSFGIPAIVCCAATQRISDGASIKVDGNQGCAILLEESS